LLVRKYASRSNIDNFECPYDPNGVALFARRIEK
jgi:hypothetical protein